MRGIGLMSVATLVSGLVGCLDTSGIPSLDEVPLVASDRCAQPREVIVSRVLDGDTFDIVSPSGGDGDEPERVRMLGIDAPEIAHPPDDPLPECGGPEAAEELRRLIEGQIVLLTFDRTCQGVFGRTLAYVWTNRQLNEEEPMSVNQELVEDGFVRVFDEDFGQILFQDDYLQSEALARSRGLGIWSPTPPTPNQACVAL